MSEQPLDPNNPCSTCAFGKSGGAADEVQNRLRGKLAAFSGVPFWCHHSRSGPEYDNTNALGPLQLVPSERRICAGWKEAVAALFGTEGRFGFTRGDEPDSVAVRMYQRQLGNQALDALNRFIRETEPALKETAKLELQNLCKAVFAVDEP